MSAAPPAVEAGDTQLVPLGLALGGGWCAASAWLGRSPLVLVLFEHEFHDPAYARVDVDKGVLLDRQTVDISPEDRARLVLALRVRVRGTARTSFQ